MEIFDLGIAWNTQGDNEFVEELNNHALKNGLRPYLIHGYNFYGSLKDIADDKLFLRFFLDRTVHQDHTFSGLAAFLKKKGSIFINHPDSRRKSGDKITMRDKFRDYNIPAAETFFLNNKNDYDSLLGKLKHVKPADYIFKPADSSGEKPAKDIQNADDLHRLKETNEHPGYIAQKKIEPLIFGKRPAWFKVFYCLGEVIPCWNDPLTNTCDMLYKEEAYDLGLRGLWKLTRRIKDAAKLCFFSTQLILSREDKELIVMDYTDDRPDMRKKSKFSDGVPDEAVNLIIDRCSLFAKSTI